MDENAAAAGRVKNAWLREAAIEACDDGLLEDEEVQSEGEAHAQA